MIVCAGKIEQFPFAKAIGIGLVESAINLSSLLLKAKNMPKEIIFVGTFGLYSKDGKIKILDIIESCKALNLESSALLNLSYSPLLNLDNVSYETNLINCSNFITQNSEISAKFAKLGLLGENMELYSVLEVAKKFQIPARGILCATNFCDESAHKDFIKNHSQAKKLLENYIKEREIL